MPMSCRQLQAVLNNKLAPLRPLKIYSNDGTSTRQPSFLPGAEVQSIPHTRRPTAMESASQQVIYQLMPGAMQFFKAIDISRSNCKSDSAATRSSTALIKCETILPRRRISDSCG